MAIHRDHVGCHRLCINTGSKSSYLQWTRGFEEQPVRVNYSGPSFQVVGGIHSNFYDFGNVHHQSVNCDPKSSADSVELYTCTYYIKILNMPGTCIVGSSMKQNQQNYRREE